MAELLSPLTDVFGRIPCMRGVFLAPRVAAAGIPGVRRPFVRTSTGGDLFQPVLAPGRGPWAPPRADIGLPLLDDATVQDWASSKGSGQWAFVQLNTLLGTPFADSKRQPKSHRGDFLGLSHDMSRALSDGVVHFWPRDRIVQKVTAMLSEAESSSCLHPGQAAKLYGILNFFEQGVYGKVGAGSLWAIKERQYEATTQITPDLLDNFRCIRAIIRAKPQRQLPVLPLPCKRFVCASDAAEEPDTGGTGGFLVVWFSGSRQTREGFAADIHPWWYSVWKSAEVHIAQLEISMVAYALLGARSISGIAAASGSSTTSPR